MSQIGPSFSMEIAAAGLSGLPFSWGADGRIEFGPEMTDAQRRAVLAVYDAHDPGAPAPPGPDEDLAAAIGAATSLAELKAALLGRLQAGQRAQVAGRPV